MKAQPMSKDTAITTATDAPETTTASRPTTSSAFGPDNWRRASRVPCASWTRA